MESKQPPNDFSRLLQLPVELRVEIYQYIIPHDDALKLRLPSELRFQQWKKDKIHLIPIYLLLVCRQIYMEELPIFYTHRIFRHALSQPHTILERNEDDEIVQLAIRIERGRDSVPALEKQTKTFFDHPHVGLMRIVHVCFLFHRVKRDSHYFKTPKDKYFTITSKTVLTKSWREDPAQLPGKTRK